MHITAPRPVALAMTALCTAALLTLSACSDPSPEPPDPATSDTISPSPPDPEWTDPTIDPDWTDPTIDPDWPDPIPVGPGDTDPCAFPGDLLCPTTPIVVPAPDLSPW